MNPKVEDFLESGNANVIGIGFDEAYGGWVIGTGFDGGSLSGWSDEEKVELADAMIVRWEQWKKEMQI